ncbi:Spo0B domain-containing protein [Lentibacillus salinarum]|uniref:Spo0B domain-containing protein n=1 Tax=Lentibacillus salinarum TaxID=446820 RepID=A0ABW3ZWZ7_9BACI
MEEQDVIQLLRHYRHDLVNQLQVVQGYASMGKTAKVQQKLTDYLWHLQEEGKLVSLNAPAFALYMLQLATLHTNFRLVYHIHIDGKDLQSVDRLLVERCKHVMEKIETGTDCMVLYDLDVQLYEGPGDIIELVFTVSGDLSDMPSSGFRMEDSDQGITVQQQANDMTFIVRIPCKRGG